jgi:transposase
MLALYQPAVILTHIGDSQSVKSLILCGPVLEGMVMGAAIGLRADFDGAALRRLARTTKSANQGRRLLALAEIYDGGSRGDAARIGGVGLQIVRDWVVRFNARGSDGLLDGKAPGKPRLLNDAQRRALVEIVESGPIPAIHGVVRWRLIDLAWWLHEEFAISLDETTVGRELNKLGYVKLTARPRHHAQNELAMEAFKKGALPTRWQRSKQPFPAQHP